MKIDKMKLMKSKFIFNMIDFMINLVYSLFSYLLIIIYLVYFVTLSCLIALNCLLFIYVVLFSFDIFFDIFPFYLRLVL